MVGPSPEHAGTEPAPEAEAAITPAAAARRTKEMRDAIARKMLNRPLPEGYRDEWARHFASLDLTGEKQVREEQTARAALIFRLGEEWLALPTSCLEEVAAPRPIRTLPHRRNRIVCGLVNVRGELLICISLGELLGIEERKTGERNGRAAAVNRMIVIGDEGRRVAFAVDEVHGIHRYHTADLSDVPATIGLGSSTFAAAVLSWRDHAVGCLDDRRLLAMIDRSIA